MLLVVRDMVKVVKQSSYSNDPLPPILLTSTRPNMAADQAPLALDQSRVGSEDYLSSLTRRLDVLEKKLVGNSGIKEDQPPLNKTVEVSTSL